MLGRTRILPVLAIALFALSATDAHAKGKKPMKDPRLETTKIFDLDWHASWKACVVKNRKASKEARPILFLRILGDLADKT